MKQAFATALIDAISDNSAQKLYLLCNNFNDQKKMGMESDLTEAKLNEIVLKNCTIFLNTINFDISEYSLDFVNIHGANDAVELTKGYLVIFADSVCLILKKEGSNTRLEIDVEMPIIINDKIQINNPLLIKCREYEESSPVTYSDIITLTDSNNQTLELTICDTDLVKSYLKKYKTDAQDYISDDPWYLYKGNLVLDSFTLTNNVIIKGDLSVHEALVEINTNLIVLGKTIVNAISLDESNDVFLLGGIEFNIAVLSMGSGPFRVLRNLNGPFVYTDSDSTSIERVDNVTCYVDYAYGQSHGDTDALIKDKYLNFIDDEEIGIDIDLIVEALKFGKNILKENNKKNFINIKKLNLENRETVISLLKENGLYLNKLDEKFRADKELIDIAIGENAAAFKYIADHLKTDDTYIYELIEKEGRVLEFVKKRFKKDKNLVLLAIESTAYALADAHKSIRADKEVVLTAINKEAKVLEYAADSLKEDEEILLAAINNNVDAIKYAPPSIINNEKVMLALIKKAPKYLDEDALEKYRNDKAFIMKALAENHLVFNYLNKELQKDEEIRSLSGRI